MSKLKDRIQKLHELRKKSRRGKKVEEGMKERKQKILEDIAKETLKEKGKEIKKADEPMRKLVKEMDNKILSRTEGITPLSEIVRADATKELKENVPDLVKRLEESSKELEKPGGKAREREKRGKEWKKEGFKPGKEAKEEFRKHTEREKIEDKYLPEVKSPKASEHLLKSQTKRVTEDFKDLKELMERGTRNKKDLENIKNEHKWELQEEVRGIGPKAADSIVEKAWELASSERKKKGS